MEHPKLEALLFDHNGNPRGTVDWDAVRAYLSSLDEVINEIDADESECKTLLSELLLPFSSHFDRIVPLIRVFLDCGFDPAANGGKNGGLCLEALCYIYGDAILDAAKLLLDAGADPNYTEIEDGEGTSLMDTIDSNSYYWNTGYYEDANLFCAYRRLIEAAQHGEDYHKIKAPSACFGKPIAEIGCYTADETFRHNDIQAPIGYVIRCDDEPLIINPFTEMFVDPLAFPQLENYRDCSAQFSSLIGQRITEFAYLDAYTARLTLDSGDALMCFCDKNGELTLLFYPLKASEEPILTHGCPIEEIALTAYRIYSDSARDYTENSLLLRIQGNIYYLYPRRDCGQRGAIRCQNLLEYRPAQMRKRLAFQSIRFEEALYEDNALIGLRFLCDGRHLYLISEQNSELRLYLSRDPIDCKAFNLWKGERLPFSLLPSEE